MASLIPLSSAADLLPLTIGEVTLSEITPEAITWVAPFDDLAEVAPGLAFPKPGEMTSNADTRALWVSGGQALVLGNPVWPEDAALVDQSDGWTVIQLEGSTARRVLARLTPIDLRDKVFPENATARTLVGHMTASLTRTGDTAYEIMVFRSMAQTLVHELTRAMKGVVARAAL